MLGGRPLVQWSIDVLSAAGCAPVVLVVPEELVLHAHSAWGTVPDLQIAAGGATRQASVGAGLELVTSERVVVHDAARPFVSPEMVTAVLRALEGADAAVAAVPLDETVKSVRDGRVVETIDRSSLWRIQTPQAFGSAVLRTAHEKARADAFEATDDAQLVERIGGRVVVVPGSRDNLKLTYPEDFVLAERLAGARGR